MPKSEPGVTVVVATLNREQYLADTLGDLLDQDDRPLEVLVVDQSDSPSSSALDLERRSPDLIRYHHVPFRGLPLARNYGWRAARHELILYVDDDIRCPPDLVSRHAAALAGEGVGVVAGGIDEPGRPSPVTRDPGRFHRWTATPVAGFHLNRPGYVDHARGCNFSTRRDVLVEVGGFDEALSVGSALYEELEYCLRVREAGYRVLFHPPARLTHLVSPDNGCRVPEPRSYIRALAHNRSVVIRRHLAWFRRPTAFGMLLRIALGSARLHRDPAVLGCALAGAREGYRSGGLPPRCTGGGNPTAQERSEAP